MQSFVKEPRLTKDHREQLKHICLQYMFDFAEENPHLCEVYSANNNVVLIIGKYVFFGLHTDTSFIKEMMDYYHQIDTDYLIVFYDNESINQTLDAMQYPSFHNKRILYRYNPCNYQNYSCKRVIPITKFLLESPLENKSMIINEVLETNTYLDMESFYNHGIGMTYVDHHRIVAFCTSEYPSKKSLAIGIAVEEPYQKQGIATEMTHAFINVALKRSLDIYWESWIKNEASQKTAIKCGFDVIAEYSVRIIAYKDE